MKWRDLKETAPRQGAHVLLFTVTRRILEGYRNIHWQGGFCTEPPERDRGTCIEGVTHWMPAPQPPSQESK